MYLASCYCCCAYSGDVYLDADHLSRRCSKISKTGIRMLNDAGPFLSTWWKRSLLLSPSLSRSLSPSLSFSLSPSDDATSTCEHHLSARREDFYNSSKQNCATSFSNFSKVWRGFFFTLYVFNQTSDALFYFLLLFLGKWTHAPLVSCPTNNTFLMNFWRSSNAEILLISTNWTYELVTKRAKTCVQCAYVPTELSFCIPTLLVG